MPACLQQKMELRDHSTSQSCNHAKGSAKKKVILHYNRNKYNAYMQPQMQLFLKSSLSFNPNSPEPSICVSDIVYRKKIKLNTEAKLQSSLLSERCIFMYPFSYPLLCSSWKLSSSLEGLVTISLCTGSSN